jgi:RNA recognition motif-containing protein
MKIYVGGIPCTSTEEEIGDLFASFGDVQSIYLPIDLMTRRPKGVGVVEMLPRSARAAIAQLDGRIFGGRRVTVRQERPLPPNASESEIEVVNRLRKRLLQHYRLRPEAVRFVDRVAFESLIADLFEAEGFHVELTRRTRDGGYDVVAIQSGRLNLRLLIECKRPHPGGKIGVGVVRELLSVKADHRATKGVLVTTGSSTRDARELLDQHEWELEGKDYADLLSWLREPRASRSSDQ